MISIKSMLQLIAFILLDMGSIFLPVCTACKILLDSGYCKFRVFGYWFYSVSLRVLDFLGSQLSNL